MGGGRLPAMVASVREGSRLDDNLIQRSAPVCIGEAIISVPPGRHRCIIGLGPLVEKRVG